MLRMVMELSREDQLKGGGSNHSALSSNYSADDHFQRMGSTSQEDNNASHQEYPVHMTGYSGPPMSAPTQASLPPQQEAHDYGQQYRETANNASSDSYDDLEMEALQQALQRSMG